MVLILFLGIYPLVSCSSKYNKSNEDGLSNQPTSFYSINSNVDKTYYKSKYSEVVEVKDLSLDTAKL